MSLGRQIALLVAVLAAITIVAELLGAPNLGTALSFAQIAFALAVTVLIVKR